MATVIDPAEAVTTKTAAPQVNPAETPAQTDKSQGDVTRTSFPISEVFDEVPWDIKVCMTLAVAVPLVGSIGASVLLWQYGWMGWEYVAMLLGGWLVTELGITVGFHRLMSHRSFETFRIVRIFWMIMGALSVQGSPLVWSAVHRRHHELSDKDGDPHSPHLHGDGWWNAMRGLVYSHMGWLFSRHWAHPQFDRYVPDLLEDKLLVAVDKIYYVFVAASLAIPAAIGYAIDGGFGAVMGVLWGGLVRVFVSHHVTWSINSVCHVFGKREYESKDLSRNNVIFGVLAQGEGWHNNHHAFPSSARHGLKWWQFDMSWIIIRTMKAIGLAWNVKLPDPRALEAKRLSPAK